MTGTTPPNFAPLLTTRRLEFVRGLPAPRLVMTVGAALLALALATGRMDAAGVTLLAGCAAVQAWPVLAAVVADSLDVAFPRFFWARCGLNFHGFGVLAAWLPWPGRARAARRGARDGRRICEPQSSGPGQPEARFERKRDLHRLA